MNFFRQPFAQYIRTDLDVRYNYRFNDVGSIVYRGFFGIGIPYGNSKAIPFEKQYFSGGSNGIRAWQVRTLGPGSYIPTDTVHSLTRQLISNLRQMPSTGLSFSGSLKEQSSWMQVIYGPIRMILHVREHSLN